MRLETKVKRTVRSGFNFLYELFITLVTILVIYTLLASPALLMRFLRPWLCPHCYLP